MGIFSKVELLYGTVTLPRTLVIENRRLGLCNRVLQVACLLWVLYNIMSSKQYLTKYEPVGQIPEVWVSAGDGAKIADVTSQHCTQPESFNYAYSENYVFTPGKCRKLPNGESYEKTGANAMFPTIVKDSFVESVASDGNCAGLAMACSAKSGTYEASASADTPCTCTVHTLDFVRNPEEVRLHMSHGYEVGLPTIPGQEQKYVFGRDKLQATHGKGDDMDTINGEKGQLLTIIQKRDSQGWTNCAIGAERTPGAAAIAEWRQGDVGDGIQGTLKEWLACGGVDLDDTSQSLKSNLEGEVGEPSLRVAGAVLLFDFVYEGVSSHSESWFGRLQPQREFGFAGAVCYVRVSVVPTWNSWHRVAYSAVPDQLTGAGSYRYREAHGVTLSTRAKGAFWFFDYNMLITTMVNALVLLGLPGTVIQFIALYCIGLVSKIYKRAQAQTLNILAEISGLSARMMTGLETFHGLTEDGKGEELTQKEFRDRAIEVYKNGVKECVLTDLEIERMLRIVVQQLDKDGDGTICMGNFLAATTSNEVLPKEYLAQFFDSDRTRHPGEVLFTDPRLLEARKDPKPVAEHLDLRVMSV